MLERIKFDTVTLLSRMQVRSQEEVEREELERQERLARAMQFQHAAPPSVLPETVPESTVTEDTGPTTFARPEPKVGRNEPCPCGSGKKYKQCHGNLALQGDIGRNEPCPCGSGKKFKHCHGAIGPA
jgi:preprotein translocase subunit SecA